MNDLWVLNRRNSGLGVAMVLVRVVDCFVHGARKFEEDVFWGNKFTAEKGLAISPPERVHNNTVKFTNGGTKKEREKARVLLN